MGYDYPKYNIECLGANAVAPGVIVTEMASTIPDSALAAMLSQVPMGRLGRPDEVAGAILLQVANRRARKGLVDQGDRTVVLA